MEFRYPTQEPAARGSPDSAQRLCEGDSCPFTSEFQHANASSSDRLLKGGERFDIDSFGVVIEQIIDLKTRSGSGVLQNRIRRQIFFEDCGSVVSIHGALLECIIVEQIDLFLKPFG